MRLFLSCLLLAACGDSDPEGCVESSSCESGSVCVDGECVVAADDAGPTDGGPPPSDTGPDDSGPVVDANEPDTEGGEDTGPDIFIGAGCESFPELFIDEACTVPTEGIFVTEPSHPLWSDGLVKTRYLRLPDGTQIDTSNPDGWIFPQGTVAWKTFATEDGQRLETRRMEKTGDGQGPGEWEMRSFAWDAAGESVTEVPEGGMENVLGTDHDIPSRSDCITCHSNGIPDVLLGVSAILLNHSDSPLSLGDLNAMGLVTDEVDETAAVFPGNDVEQAALGYLHTNCGSCHGGPAAAFGLEMRVAVDDQDVADTDVFAAIGAPSFWMSMFDRIRPGDRDASAIYLRAALRGDPAQMPPLGTEVVDDEGLAAVGTWIDSLEPAGPPDDTVFYPVTAENGRRSGRDGADTYCQDRLPGELTGRIAHAFLCVGFEIHTMPTVHAFDGSRPLVTLDGTEIAPNWQAVEDGNLTNPMSITGLSDPFFYTTGCGCGQTCGLFTSENPAAVVCQGDVRATDEGAFSTGARVTSCGEQIEFLCFVEPI